MAEHLLGQNEPHPWDDVIRDVLWVTIRVVGYFTARRAMVPIFHQREDMLLNTIDRIRRLPDVTFREAFWGPRDRTLANQVLLPFTEGAVWDIAGRRWAGLARQLL